MPCAQLVLRDRRSVTGFFERLADPRDMLGRVAADGAVQITRFSGDKEALRLLATMREVHTELGTGPFSDCVACVPAGAFLSVLVKRSPFTPDELDRLAAFERDSGAPVVVHPARAVGGVLARFVRTEDPAAFLAAYPFDIRPVSDDRPYFFHFHRWTDLGRARADLDTPMVVTQGNPLFLLGQLVLGVALALLLLVPTLRFASRAESGARRRALPAFGYFGSIGAGYLVLQVALLQKLVLLLGHPLHSLTGTLFVMLLATGAGAFLSRGAFSADAPARRLWWIPLGLAVWLGAFAFASEDLPRWAVPLPALARFAVAGAVVAPVGLLLGVPFAHGIASLERRWPAIVPWAWAANAATTVVGAIVAVIVSINFGFDAVFAVGVALYALAASSVKGLTED